MKILKEMKMSQIPGEKKEIYKKYLSESATRESMQKDHQRNCIIFLGIFLLATRLLPIRR